MAQVALDSDGRSLVELNVHDLELRVGVPLLVQATRLSSASTAESVAFVPMRSTFYTRNPYTMIIFCSMIACLALLYTFVAVYCGSELEYCVDRKRRRL